MALVFLIFFSLLHQAAQSITLNEVWATVNDAPITKLDIELMREKMPSLRAILPMKLKSDKDILDYLIDREIIAQMAKEQTLRAPEDKLEERIDALVQANGLKDRKELDKKLQKRGSSLAIYEEEIRKQLLLYQIMNLFVPTTPPSRKEIKEWYNKNRKKLGKEVNLKLITLPYAATIKSELAVNKKISNIRRALLRRQGSAEEIAKKNGAFVVNTGWKNLAELDQMVAGTAFQMQRNRPGSISKVFKTRGGRQYGVFQFLGIRNVRFENVQGKIFRLLYAQRQDQALNTWMKKKREQTAIKIYADLPKK